MGVLLHLLSFLASSFLHFHFDPQLLDFPIAIMTMTSVRDSHSFQLLFSNVNRSKWGCWSPIVGNADSDNDDEERGSTPTVSNFCTQILIGRIKCGDPHLMEMSIAIMMMMMVIILRIQVKAEEQVEMKNNIQIKTNKWGSKWRKKTWCKLHDLTSGQKNYDINKV